jgi:REP element-mobilizing transposase RayT
MGDLDAWRALSPLVLISVKRGEAIAKAKGIRSLPEQNFIILWTSPFAVLRHLIWNEGFTGMVWQRSFYDHPLRKDEDLLKVAEYIIYNPVRKGLVEDWRDYPFSWHKWM